MGITRVDTILMILGVSTRMNDIEKEVTTKLLMQGFADTAEEAKTSVTGGQTVFNPWCMIGGTAMATLKKEDIIFPSGAEPGDVLIMTKPLGTQLAGNFNQWIKEEKFKEKWLQIASHTTEEKVRDAYEKAVFYMSQLNLPGAILMQKYKAHGATDVTGFGLLGHAKNLAIAQKNKVDLVISKLPLLNDIYKLDKIARNFRLVEGLSAETSGGLLICLKKEAAGDFISDYEKMTGVKAWMVGDVVEGSNQARILPNPEIIEV